MGAGDVSLARRSMVGLSLRERDHAARFESAPLLHVATPSVVAGRRVLVYDDVFTSGTTLPVVARKLIDAGATGVYAVALARPPLRV